jgi:hypothetical protein
VARVVVCMDLLHTVHHPRMEVLLSQSYSWFIAFRGGKAVHRWIIHDVGEVLRRAGVRAGGRRGGVDAIVRLPTLHDARQDSTIRHLLLHHNTPERVRHRRSSSQFFSKVLDFSQNPPKKLLV